MSRLARYILRARPLVISLTLNNGWWRLLVQNLNTIVILIGPKAIQVIQAFDRIFLLNGVKVTNDLMWK